MREHGCPVGHLIENVVPAGGLFATAYRGIGGCVAMGHQNVNSVGFFIPALGHSLSGVQHLACIHLGGVAKRGGGDEVVHGYRMHGPQQYGAVFGVGFLVRGSDQWCGLTSRRGRRGRRIRYAQLRSNAVRGGLNVGRNTRSILRNSGSEEKRADEEAGHVHRITSALLWHTGTSGMEQIAISFEPQRKTWTVSELSGRIRGLLGGEFSDIWVAGEISGCRTATSGHCYFTLKDEESQIQCVCFRGAMRYLRFKPQDGVAALVRGSIDVYEARGQYQLVAESIEPQGHGALQLAFEQLKKKLAAEGLFEASRKRPLPRLPSRIGIVTSPGGAVIQDLLNILLRRFPGLHVRIWPALVQGEGSVEQVCQGLDYFSRSRWAQVVIVARGGGSIEDLWTFNEEAVARAIANSAVPVISAIGHETDFTIADFVADLRAPTPSAAAELAVRTGQEIVEQLSGTEHKLTQHVRYRLAMAARDLHQRGVERASAALHRRIGRAQQRVDEVDYRVRGAIQRGLDAHRRLWQQYEARLRGLDLRVRFGDVRRRLHIAEAAAVHAWQARAALAARRLETLGAHLTQLSPLRVLERGYAIVLNEHGALVKHSGDAPPDSAVEIRVAHARLKARITASAERS